MRVSSQLSNVSGLLKQMPSVPRAESTVPPVQQSGNGTNENEALRALKSQNPSTKPVPSPLVNEGFASPANLVLESMHSLVKAESQKGPTTAQNTSPESFSAGPQTLEMPQLPENEFEAPSRIDLSALSAKPNPPGSEFNNEWTQGLKEDASPTALAKLSDSRFNVAPVQTEATSAGGPQSLRLSPPESSELFVSNAVELNLATTELTTPEAIETSSTSIVNGPSIDPEQGMRPEIKNLYAVMKRISEGTSYEFTNYQAEDEVAQPNRNYTNSLDIVGVGREPTAIFLSQAS